MQEDRRKNSIWALLLTLLLTVGTLALLLRTSLQYEYVPNRQDLTQLAQDSILFGGEFVMLGDMPDALMNDVSEQEAASESVSPDEGENPDIEADDREDAGEATQKTPPTVTQQTESPQKVKKPKVEEPKKPGPTKQNDKQETKPKAKHTNAEEQEAKTKNVNTQQQATTSATDKKVKNAFGGGKGSGGGKQGDPNGTSSVGRFAGRPSINGLAGYTLENWAKPNPNSKWSGRVTVRVTVDPRGKVIQASAISATGSIASHPEMKRACEQAALKSSFSVPKNTTTQGIGNVTYIWY